MAYSWVRRRELLQQEVAAEKQRCDELAAKFEAVLRDRERMAADLHDSLAQNLAALAFQIEASEALLEKDLGRSRHHLVNASSILNRTRDEVRRTVASLRSPMPAGRTLAEALREFAAIQSAGRPTRISVEYRLEAHPVPHFIAGNLLLLAREAVSNAMRHSGATAVLVRVRIFGRSLELAVIDNGCGFDVALAPGVELGHFGLQGMRERVKRLGGSFSVESERAKGTQVVIRVDLA